jgi:hypothetical protein
MSTWEGPKAFWKEVKNREQEIDMFGDDRFPEKALCHLTKTAFFMSEKASVWRRKKYTPLGSL